ncbi:hydroxymethylglutaryl-CoA lyase [Streptomyces sp. NRRL B-1140]|uniref:hydroxymethylglutaryl-CoA lyase n=1 Tax=Streptomyces sp. NRRL B-1140 TaxID=1415549 RepID=UPI0006ADBAC1|nr:hydroxymethylglutaryl-CoA lyase [Streptomyces sp. NRRL B-1140]KOX06105.1 hydroxymethylglutaryl-CoA lyase [Streptomyces sp. NRRL B-1140]
MNVEVTDVVLRDGLQDEDAVVATRDKIAIAQALVDAGITTFEVASFVNPARVPQMADAGDVVDGTRGLGARRLALALNAKGVHRAAASGVEVVEVVASASSGHSRANAGRDVDQAIDELAAAVAEHPGTAFIAGVSTAFVCPFDGPVPAARLVEVVARVAGIGVERVGLADTLGIATPEQVATSVAAVQQALPDVELGLHLHNAKDQALDTVDAALELGIRHFDSAVGGYGGCPFAPGAHGNLATEALVAHLHARGVHTGVDVSKLAGTAQLVQQSLVRGDRLPVRPTQ